MEKNVTYNQISFHLSASPDIREREMHPYHEILFYIDGKAELLTAEGRQTLSRESLLIIPKGKYHFFKTENGAGFLRLKISIPEHVFDALPVEIPMKGIRIAELHNKRLEYILGRFLKIMAGNEKATGFYAYSALMMLLSELDMMKSDIPKPSFERNEAMIALAKYISENPEKDLSVKRLSELHCISSSGIIHLFKKEFGISLHKYITQKRLLYAKELITSGEYPTKIHTKAGFRDYSSFYKAYIAFWGYPPSREKEKLGESR